jgi:hypothetical protein
VRARPTTGPPTTEGEHVGPIAALAAHAAAGLVLLAGIAKIRRPGATSEALALTRVPASSGLVRALGTAEIALALGVLTLGGRWSFAMLALAYLGFIVVAERQRRAGRGCGCFGTSTGRVGPLHLAVDAVAAAAAASAAWAAAPGVIGILPSNPISAIATLGLVVLVVVLGQLTLTALPELLAVRERAAQASTLPDPKPFARVGAEA